MNIKFLLLIMLNIVNLSSNCIDKSNPKKRSPDLAFNTSSQTSPTCEDPEPETHKLRLTPGLRIDTRRNSTDEATPAPSSETIAPPSAAHSPVAAAHGSTPFGARIGFDPGLRIVAPDSGCGAGSGASRDLADRTILPARSKTPSLRIDTQKNPILLAKTKDSNEAEPDHVGHFLDLAFNAIRDKDLKDTSLYFTATPVTPPGIPSPNPFGSPKLWRNKIQTSPEILGAVKQALGSPDYEGVSPSFVAFINSITPTKKD